MSTKFGILFVFMLFSASVMFAQTSNQRPEKTKENPNPNMEKVQVETTVLSDKEINESKGLPEDFPVYRNTGNKEADDAHYAEEKRIWIENNPEKYNALMTKQPVTVQEQKEIEQKERAK